MSVLIVTSLGDIVVDLHTSRCPLTTKNFIKLCKIKYYNGCLFHTVQKDFTAQTGDPTGKGTGGDSVYKFLYGEQARFFGDEIHPDLKHSKTGTVAMANAGENLNASQFYFTLRDDLDYLDGKKTVFGEVAEGLETLMRINEAFVDDKGRPYKNIRIKHTYILDDPFDDPPQLAELILDASPDGKPPDEVEDVRLEDDWVPMDEQMDAAAVEESVQKKDANSRAVVLEMIGDIPDAEIKPPENVLFVCKLNPVTQDRDLDIIFSRFGNVLAADIIRDYKTGDSLCYAFIEFETQEACEQAYFKMPKAAIHGWALNAILCELCIHQIGGDEMGLHRFESQDTMDNALIDDRRIHVDFSQSVAKLWSQYRRTGKRGQADQGKGCFKCGALDHIAKNCPGDSNTKSEPQKYILKANNAQHGDGDKSYEMVFDGDGLARSRHEEKRYSEHEAEENTKRRNSGERGSDDSRHRDCDKVRYFDDSRRRDRDKIRDSRERHEQDSRSPQHREDEMIREISRSKHSGGRKDDDRIEREVRERIAERRDESRTNHARSQKGDDRREREVRERIAETYDESRTKHTSSQKDDDRREREVRERIAERRDEREERKKHGDRREREARNNSREDRKRNEDRREKERSEQVSEENGHREDRKRHEDRREREAREKLSERYSEREDRKRYRDDQHGRTEERDGSKRSRERDGDHYSDRRYSDERKRR